MPGSAHVSGELFVAAQPKGEIAVAHGAFSLLSFTYASGRNLSVEEIQRLSLRGSGGQDGLVGAAFWVTVPRVTGREAKTTGDLELDCGFGSTGRGRRSWSSGPTFRTVGRPGIQIRGQVFALFPKGAAFPARRAAGSGGSCAALGLILPSSGRVRRDRSADAVVLPTSWSVVRITTWRSLGS